MKKFIAVSLLVLLAQPCLCWGFYAHRKINYYAVFLLPPEMVLFYRSNIDFLSDHAVDPDKRRYAVPEEGPRHFIDIDHYGPYPYEQLPRKWNDAVARYSLDSLNNYGIVPWWIQIMLHRLTDAFKEKDQAKILKVSAEMGHYISDAHVPLHAHTNHNGQFTSQRGIHGFWESRVPELLAEKEWDFFIGKAEYISNAGEFIWQRVLESGAAADSVLKMERQLSNDFPTDQKFAFENRNGLTIRQYSSAFASRYNTMLNGMIERRMRQSIFAVASFWFTAWVNAGQPDLRNLTNKKFTDKELEEFEHLNKAWKTAPAKGREHE